MKAIPWQIKYFQYLIIKPLRTFSGTCDWKNVNNETNRQMSEELLLNGRRGNLIHDL